MAEVIIVFLGILFCVWILFWVRLMSGIYVARKELRRSDQASESLERSVQQDGDSAFLTESESVCSRALADAEISNRGQIGNHIRTLFLNGLRDSSLDLGELNRRTSSGVLKFEPVLRSLLATFVIVGLLGTLFGIARAVAVFGGDEPSAKDLLQRLPGAFTPSIWGVSYSIFGSLLLVLTRWWVSDFTINLRAKTVEVLIPKLLPSRAERLGRAATRAIEASERVANFAKSIEGKSAELDGSLQRAAHYAQVISTAVRDMSQGVEVAAARVDVTFGNLNEKIRVFSEALDRLAEFRQGMRTHEDRVVGLLEDFRSVAKGNADVSHNVSQFIRKGTDDLLSATREMYKPVKESADEIKQANTLFTQKLEEADKKQTEVLSLFTTTLGDLAVEQTSALVSQFTDWRAELRGGAEIAKRSLDNLKVPFEQSAETLRQQAANSIHQMSTLISDLKTQGASLDRGLGDVVGALRELASKDERASPGTEFPYEKLEARFKSLDTRLGGLEQAIVKLAQAAREQPPREYPTTPRGFWERLFRRD